MFTVPMNAAPRPSVSRTLLLALALTALVLLSLSVLPSNSQVQPPERDAIGRDRSVMRFKLHYTQGILEGITMENFPLLATNAQKLAALTREVSWRIRHTAEYERLTADLRRQTDALLKAAKDENADAATVAYFQLTVSCVTCHKHLRGQGVVLPP
ncbi:MAG: hypothetical protein RJA22_2508 [Verrucomicrobiota bacterium]|jgi:hypothetical protein